MNRKTARTIDRIIKVIKSRKELDKVDFAILCDLSPSTFYNYKDLILRLHPEIIFEEGKYKLIESEQISPEI